METVTDSYAHVLLFACPPMRYSVGVCMRQPEKNLELADAHYFNPHCPCGWTGSMSGLHALKHWVERWKIPVNIGRDAAGSFDSDPKLGT
jgi:hypothetical protein